MESGRAGVFTQAGLEAHFSPPFYSAGEHAGQSPLRVEGAQWQKQNTKHKPASPSFLYPQER